jgi:hypothetical protein
VNRNFKDPQNGFETIKDVFSRIDQKEFEVTLVGSNSDWAAKDLKRGIGVRNLDYLHDGEAWLGSTASPRSFCSRRGREFSLCDFWRRWALVVVVPTPSGIVVA